MRPAAPRPGATEVGRTRTTPPPPARPQGARTPATGRGGRCSRRPSCLPRRVRAARGSTTCRDTRRRRASATAPPAEYPTRWNRSQPSARAASRTPSTSTSSEYPAGGSSAAYTSRSLATASTSDPSSTSRVPKAAPAGITIPGSRITRHAPMPAECSREPLDHNPTPATPDTATRLPRTMQAATMTHGAHSPTDAPRPDAFIARTIGPGAAKWCVLFVQ